MSAFLYVGGLNENISEADLFQSFSVPLDGDIPTGLISSKINRDVITRLSRCSGFLNFSTAEDAQRTLELRQHMEVGGRPVVLKPYRARDPTHDAVENRDRIFKAISNNCNTFVNPLPRGMTETELANMMSHHFPDAVVSCHVPPGRPFGYVLFKDEASAMDALRKGSIDVATVTNGNTEDEQKETVTVNILPYKSYNDRTMSSPAAREQPRPKSETPQRFNRERCAVIRGAPSKWTDVEVEAAVKPYGEPMIIKFVGGTTSASHHVVVEFADASSVARCVEGLDRRWCSSIDQFSLLNSLESQRVSLLLDRQRERDYNAPRLNVSFFQAEGNAWGRPGAKRRNPNGKATPNMTPAQPSIPESPMSNTSVVADHEEKTN